MRKDRNYSAAVVRGSLTSAVALLAGLSGAQAQSPVPSANPLSGAGSFPGSFIVPGTNTSLHVGGVVQLDVYWDMSARDGADSASISSTPLEGNGTSRAISSAAVSHNLRFRANSTRPNFETRTPSAYGEVKTFWEIDFQGNTAQPGAPSTAGGSLNELSQDTTNCCVNGEVPRLRQAYGTLGPWLFGQTNSNFADLDAYPDVLDGGGAPGEMTAVDIRQPQVRYTMLFAGGISDSVSAEEATSYGIIAAGTQGLASGTPVSAAGTVSSTGIFFNSFSSPSWSPQHLPALVNKLRIDQPWGHVAWNLAVQQLREENDFTSLNAAIPGSPLALAGGGSHISKWGYMTSIGGHINTIGKDKVTFNVQQGMGAVGFTYDWVVGSSNAYGDGLICATPTATTFQCSEPRVASGNIGYSHWWTDELRSGVVVGWAHEWETSSEATWFKNQAASTALAAIDRNHNYADANLLWTPVRGVQLGIEYEWWHRVVQSGARGNHNRIETQAAFTF